MKIYTILILVLFVTLVGCRSLEEINPQTNGNNNLCTLPRQVMADTANGIHASLYNGITVGGCVITDSIHLIDTIIPTGQQPILIHVGGVVNTNSGGSDPFPGTSNCIEQKINLFSHNPFICAGATVTEVSFNSQSVYVFYPGPCGVDVAFDVYDSACNYLGTLGGIANSTQINGVDFNSNSTLVNTLWTK